MQKLVMLKTMIRMSLPPRRLQEFAMNPVLASPHLGVTLVTLSLIFGAGTLRSACGQESKAKPSARRAASALKVEDENGKEIILSPEALAKLPRQSVNVKDRRANSTTYEGMALGEVLRSAGVTLGKNLRGPLLANYLLVEASDGYRVVFALPEVDPDMTGKVVLLADRKDGQLLNAQEGPYRVVVPDDKHNTRWVKQVTRISVRWAASMARVARPAQEEPKAGTNRSGEGRVTVEMAVKSSKNALAGRMEIYLDSEENFRDEKNFAVVISATAAAKFKDAGIDDPATHFKGRTIRVTGTVVVHENRPRIVVEDPSQVGVVSKKD
jgi:hypothetical protein